MGPKADGWYILTVAVQYPTKLRSGRSDRRSGWFIGRAWEPYYNNIRWLHKNHIWWQTHIALLFTDYTTVVAFCIGCFYNATSTRSFLFAFTHSNLWMMYKGTRAPIRFATMRESEHDFEMCKLLDKWFSNSSSLFLSYLHHTGMITVRCYRTGSCPIENLVANALSNKRIKWDFFFFSIFT